MQTPSPTFANFHWSERVIQYVIVPVLLLAVLVVKVWLSLQYRMAIWDGYVYLSNARIFLLGGQLSPYRYFEIFRPPLFPYLISLVWKITGLSYSAAVFLQPVFTVIGAYFFFLLLKEMFGLKEGIIGSLFLLAAPEAFFWTNEILVHGVAMCFMIVSVFFLWRGINEKGKYSFPLSGGALALATLTRYTTLVFVPVFLLILLALWFRSRKRMVRFPWVGAVATIVVFALIWAPWLAWNNIYAGGPFASLLLGSEFAEKAATPEPWYYFIVNMPLILTIPGSILLLVGLIDKKTIKDKARLILLFWILVFFLFHTVIDNKQVRFVLEWCPPLVAFATLGVSRIEAHLPSKTKIIASVLVAIWLSATFLLAANTSVIDANNQSATYGEFVAAAAWVDVNTNQTTIGATEMPTAFSYQTDRLFYPLDLVAGMAQNRRVTADQVMAELGIRIVVVSADTAQYEGISGDVNYVLVNQFPPYQVYLFNCLNCTKT